MECPLFVNLSHSQKATSPICNSPSFRSSDDLSDQTALHLCDDRGHVVCMKLLMNPGANLNPGDNDGITFLHTAMIPEHAEACRLLLNAGADPDKEDRDGDTGFCRQSNSSFFENVIVLHLLVFLLSSYIWIDVLGQKSFSIGYDFFGIS
eukprot:scaffold2219_cov56-Cylindrotheca_fusiformis.AAC.2